MAGKSEPLDPASAVSLSLEARVENAAVARRAVADEVQRAGLGEPVSAAAKVVVTESFTNAARHAYVTTSPGRVRVHAHADDDGITVAVRDNGNGFRPRPRVADVGGLGLLLIAALARRVELRKLPDGGTEIRARVEEDAGANGSGH